MTGYPVRLKRSPLLEAVFEIRFTLNGTEADFLPGLLFQAFGNQFPRLDQLPAGAIPKELRSKHAELSHAAQFRLQGTDEAVLFGDNVASFSATSPYPGWTNFRDRCQTLVRALHGRVERVERYSMKYINLLDAGGVDAHPLAPLQIQFEPGPFKASSGGFHLRFETKFSDVVVIVECQSGVKVETPSVTRSGVLFAIDAVESVKLDDFLSTVGTRIDATHDVIKQMFYDLLTHETLDALGPVYEEVRS